MFINSNDLVDNDELACEVCIIGSGAAGISIAREFIGQSNDIIMLESGGLNFDKRTQSLYTGENIGLKTFDLEVNRLRYFGGTTNHWAGHSRPLDAIDFEQRDWIPHSGWPIKKPDLVPYYRKAQSILDLGDYQYEDLTPYSKSTGFPIIDTEKSRMSSVVYQQSPPTRFNPKYKDELGDAKNIRVYLFANVLEIVTNEDGDHVNHLECACIDGPKFKVKAKIVILATGGMENARILLLSNKHSQAGVGNKHGLVGKFFMDHILLRPGITMSLSNLNFDYHLYTAIQRIGETSMFAVLASNDDVVKKERIANFRIHEYSLMANYSALGGIVSRVDGFDGDNPLASNRGNTLSLHMVLEPIPNPESRITLGEDKDIFGQAKLNVNWALTDQDLYNAHRALELASLEFGRLGLGRAYGSILEDPESWPANLEAGRHHCGTTKMSDSETTGVVNKDCRVFGVDNLYVAGSSVFPTIGYANPTLTIVALALRLSDHVKENLS